MINIFTLLMTCGVLLSALPVLAQNIQGQGRQEMREQRRESRDVEDVDVRAKGSKAAGPLMTMASPFYDFGDVMRRGGDLYHNFELQNSGSKPLVVIRVITSCSCLKAVFPKRPVPPGEKAVIRIVYEPLKREPGTFHKVIQVYSNSIDGRHVITVQGNSIDPKKK